MQIQQFNNIRLVLTALVSIAIWAVLIWQFNHGGVPNHHFLRRPDFPAISNWWGAALLPILTWWLSGTVKNRLIKEASEKPELTTTIMLDAKQVMVNFVLALVYGTVLSQTYILGHSDISSVLFPAILAFAVFFKVYRAEYVLGFILSMSLVFGAVLPTMFGTIMAVTAFALHTLAQSAWQFTKQKLLTKAA